MGKSNLLRKLIESKVFLAPMSGVTDIPFRIIARRNGCRFAFTEMIDVNGIFYNNIKTINMLERPKEDAPLGVQIVGQDEKKVLMAARVCEEKGFELLDFNAGCPARKVVKAGKGSALLREPLKLGRMLGKLVKQLNIPVTLKIRSGWDEENKNYIEVSRIAEEEGVSLITIHSRTQQMMYKGKPDYKSVKRLKENVGIPVFASGNIFSPEDVSLIVKETNCDGVVVARGAFGKPWIFSDIYNHLDGKKYGKYQDFDKIKKVMLEHFVICREYYDPQRLFSRMYKHVTWYLKKLKNLNEIMKIYTRLNDFQELEDFIARLQIDDRRHLFLD